jgi:DNA topoisomerase I
MSKNLVIVESPTKAKTISKFLDKDYKILSSYGHLRDLPQRDLGVDVEKDFKPKYVVAADKKPLVDELKKAAAKSDMVYFATDEDREGEAISWHLLNLLSNDGKKKLPHKRIAFHEITKPAVLKALKNPRELDQNLVDAQQARRILDRLVGYKLSPFLWKKVAKGLSAGRVQSVAVRLVVEREREIKKFKSDEYWSLKAMLKSDGKEFEAHLAKIDKKKLDKLDIKSKKAMDKILKALDGASYTVSDVSKRETSKKPHAPFTTSSLQQEAHNKLGYSAKQTMYIAQALYEGVKHGKEQTGLITYMRTDSVNLAATFLDAARDYIKTEYGDGYLPASVVKYKTKAKGAQEAHEAIRPTHIDKLPSEMKDHLDDKQFKLYDLIWRRAVASQMNPAKIDSTGIDIEANKHFFRANGSVIKFDGFLKAYGNNTKENILPAIKKDDKLDLVKLDPKQSFTEPPPRYNDASIVKKMEELGIGRPSTYAPIISTIQARNYIKREQGRFIPQDISYVVTDLLVEHFPIVSDYKFTADMEDDLDRVAHGKKKWVPILAEFYKPFSNNLEKKYMEINKKDLINEETDEKCEKCGKDMVIKTSRYGKFLACTGFPDCRNTKQINSENGEVEEEGTKEEPEKTDLKCEKCGEAMLIRQGKFGKFYACSGFPKCKNTKALDQDTGVECPKCKKGKIVAKKTKARKTFYACDGYPDCKFAVWSRPTGDKCEKCESLMVNAGKGEDKCSNKDCK